MKTILILVLVFISPGCIYSSLKYDKLIENDFMNDVLQGNQLALKAYEMSKYAQLNRCVAWNAFFSFVSIGLTGILFDSLQYNDSISPKRDAAIRRDDETAKHLYNFSCGLSLAWIVLSINYNEIIIKANNAKRVWFQDYLKRKRSNYENKKD